VDKNLIFLQDVPNLIDRIEAGLMSYGNDFTRENNPLECNLEKYCKQEDDHDFIGKEALRKIQSDGIAQKMRGILFDGDPCKPTGGAPSSILKNIKKYKRLSSNK
jgi:dimethylsulfoniopropionate demethylase